MRALEAEDVDLVLPYVDVDGEEEIRAAFDRTLKARTSLDAREVADLYFFETVVRVHRRGEGAPYTGLKPAGLDVGPVIPVAERAIESGSADELTALLTDVLQHQIKARFDHVMAAQAHATGSVAHAREYVQAMLGIQVWSHGLYGAMRAGAHGESADHEH
jgi:ADP-ribose pyrophosphatase YjhB (NUDIX family)